MKKPLTSIGLLIIGDEILTGRRQDGHFSRALGYFTARGIEISWLYYLGDDFDRLVEHFRIIKDRREVCFSFGGIGATPDDRTRQAIAAAYDVEICRHPEALKLIEEQFGTQAYPNRVLMADLPAGASLIPNGYNNIPGFFMGQTYCLPGFPEMAWPMVEWVVHRFYEVSANQVSCLESLIVPGVRESELITLLEDVQNRFPDVRVSSLPRFPSEGNWQVELAGRGPREQVDMVIAMLRTELAKRGFPV